MSDAHEDAMREAATLLPFEYCLSQGGLHHPQLTTSDCNALLNLIREQVKRMDETCVWTKADDKSTLYRVCTKIDLLNPVGKFCPMCGKRIKIED